MTYTEQVLGVQILILLVKDTLIKNKSSVLNQPKRKETLLKLKQMKYKKDKIILSHRI